MLVYLNLKNEPPCGPYSATVKVFAYRGGFFRQGSNNYFEIICLCVSSFPWQKKSLIRETKNLSTDADSSTDTKKILLVRQNSPKINLFFCAVILHPL